MVRINITGVLKSIFWDTIPNCCDLIKNICLDLRDASSDCISQVLLGSNHLIFIGGGGKGLKKNSRTEFCLKKNVWDRVNFIVCIVLDTNKKTGQCHK